MAGPRKPLDPSRIKTVSIAERPALVNESQFASPVSAGVSLADWIDSLPDILAARDFREVARAIAAAADKGRPVILGMGAHVIKVGLSPLIIAMMEQGVISDLAMNGACLVHDFEIAMSGDTSEDVAESLDKGTFGMTRETGEFINAAAKRCGTGDIGLGRAIGEAINEGDLPHKDKSLLAAAARLDLGATVHVAIGTDIVHMHPGLDPAALGQGSYRDFLSFAAAVAELDQGVYINLGSAVIMPEVFLKALAMARNLGHKVSDLTTVNMDFIRHYRPAQNVVNRPVRSGGRGYQLTGPHEIMFPLLMAAVREQQDG